MASRCTGGNSPSLGRLSREPRYGAVFRAGVTSAWKTSSASFTEAAFSPSTTTRHGHKHGCVTNVEGSATGCTTSSTSVVIYSCGDGLAVAVAGCARCSVLYSPNGRSPRIRISAVSNDNDSAVISVQRANDRSRRFGCCGELHSRPRGSWRPERRGKRLCLLRLPRLWRVGVVTGAAGGIE